ncbi:Archaeophage PsiM2, terminase large subunit [uncultured Caudovirales phage]|uniref:Archaeophage PsiM2, terminase large subunit n=1 Tax=uncultured Caudovirales phage TaxID=2100421 RepID=A0A6J5R0G9_9CAUD|nr:Archaeophage PsiM2, terminase large subunit [uncultured Caudovirales phage]
MTDIIDALRQMDAIEAEMARRSLKIFVQKTWDIVEPNRPLSWNWHLDELCTILEGVTAGTYKRVLINVSPGTMKSLLVSVFWPAWEWATNAKLRYLTASYGSHLTIRDNLRLRDIVRSPWYAAHFSLEFSSDQNAKERFNTTEGGWRIATSVGGVGTGEHPDRIIIDDPITAQQARSKTELQSANDWFDGTVSSRGVTRDTAIVVVMQRLDENDLAGHLLNKGGWEHVCWPMRYEPSRPKTDKDAGHTADKRDPRTEAGQLFWPELFTEEKVRQLELDLGPYGTAGQLQQRPSPEGGGLFKREWFRIVDAAPAVARRARGWDTAGTQDAGDWTCGVKIAEAKDTFFIEDVTRGQWGPDGVDKTMRLTAEMDGVKCAQREEKEGGSAGLAVVAARAKALKGFDYAGVSISGDKVTRAKPFRAQCEAGNVLLVRGEWNEAYIRELCNFPVGKNDDQVDGSSCAFNAVLLEPVPEPEWVTW